MQIEICSPEQPTGDYSIYTKDNQFPLRNHRSNTIGLFSFTEDDIENLLQSKYKQFQKGKYQFDVTVSRLKLVTGERSAKDRSELVLYAD